MNSLTLTEAERLLVEWENMDRSDGHIWSEDERKECAEYLWERADLGLSFWKEWLEPAPKDVRERYIKLMGLLHNENIIDAEALRTELELMGKWGSKIILRRGREFAQFLRDAKSGDLNA